MSNRILSLVVLTLALLIQPVSAQLAGNYTVDNSVATGGTNYNTLQEAATALAAGVSAPVVFSINTGSSAYIGFAIGTAITGSSAFNTVTFQPGVGQTPLISGPSGANLNTIKLGTAATLATGPSNIILSGLVVTGAPSGAGIMVAGCANVTVQNCIVYGAPAQVGSGIYLAATTGSAVLGCEVYTVGMTPGTPGSVSYSGGIAVYLSSSTCTVAGNKVHDCTGCGIFIGTSGSATAVTNCTVINNFVWNCPGTTSYTAAAIGTRRTGGLVLANNSVLMATGANAGIFMSATDGGAAAEVSNNIVRHLGTGPCFRFEASATLAATVFDYNAYDPAPTAFVGGVAAVNYATLAAWQAVAPVIGKEVNTLVGNAAYTSATDLHISPASVGFLNGSPVAAVTVDIDGNPRIVPPCRGADEVLGTGIYANFSATPTSGPAALNVNFTDTTFTSDPSGVQTWAWDFQNDGINDAFTATPSFNYVVPGIYSVKLTVTDVLNGSSTMTKTNFVTVGPYVFDAQTTPGAGNLTILPIPGIGVPTATSGFMFVSFAAPPVLGSGPFFGLIPDSFTWSIVATPAAVGNLLHWVVTPGIFPNVPLVVPPGALLSLVGLTADFVQIDLNASQTIANISNLDRITF